MPVRYVCECGMAFTVEAPPTGRPVVCPACGSVQRAGGGSKRAPSRRPTGAPTRPRPTPAETAPFTEPDRPTVRCADCGALNSTDAVICGMCGARIGLDLVTLSSEPPSAPPPPRPPASPRRDEDDFVEGVEFLTAEDGEKRRQPLRYEGEHRVPFMRLLGRMVIRPRSELEMLVTFLSYRDMLWKLTGLFLVGVVGLWLAAARFPGLPMVSGFTFGGGLPSRLPALWRLSLAFSTAAFLIGGMTMLAALAGLLTGHGWRIGPLALGFLFVVSMVNAAHLLLLPLPTGAATVGAWLLMIWEVVLVTYVINRILDCESILSVVISVVIIALTVHFYSRVYRATSRLWPEPVQQVGLALTPQPPEGAGYGHEN